MYKCKGNRPYLCICLALFGLFLLSGAGPTLAQTRSDLQENPAEPQAAAQEKPAAAAIPAPDIVIQAQKVSAELHRIQGLLHPSPTIQKVNDEFLSFIDAIQQERLEFESLEIDYLSLQQLSQIQDGWRGFRLKAEAWQRLLVVRSQELEAKRAELFAIKDQWQRTRAVAQEEDFSKALQDRIEMVLNDVSEVEQTLRNRLAAVYSLEDKVSNQLYSIAEVLNRLDLASETSRKRLFARDSRPLWAAVLQPEEGIPFFQHVKETWDQKVRLFEKFLRDNLIRLLIHIGVFIILSLFFTSLRKHIHEWTDIDDSVKASAHILSRPLSVALVIVMIVRLWIYPNNPLIVSEISRLILVIPLLRLLPGLAPPEFRRPIYGLGWLYILQLLGEILPDGSLAERLVVLLLTLLALAGMMWIVRPGGIIQTLRVNRWFLFIKTYFQLSALLFAVSIVSNIFGNLSLASLLAAGTFLSLYTFVILVMVVLVLDGLIFLLLKSRAAQSLRMVRMHNAMWNKGSRRLIRFAALFLWLSISLKALGILDPVRRGFTQILQKQLAVGTLKISLEDILAFLVTLVVSVYLAKIIRFVLNEDILPRFPLPRGVPNAISFVAYYFILFAGFIIALGAAGIEWSRFAILAGALGVGIGFGLQNLVNNFVSGLILIFERPVKVGDLIEFAGQRGEVLRIGIRSSTVRTWEGSEIIVPNGNLISSEVINWTLSDRKRRLKIYVGVAYGSDPDVVLGILNKAADEHPEVIKNPAPLATFKGFGESSLDFELRFSIREFLDWIRVQSDLYLTILRELNAAGIEIPFPQHDLHLRSLNPEVKEHLNKEKSKTKVP